MVELAFSADSTAMRENDVFSNGQAESGSTRFARTCFIDAVETLEKARQVLGGDTRSEVAHVELHA